MRSAADSADSIPDGGRSKRRPLVHSPPPFSPWMRMVEAAPAASIGTAVYSGDDHIPADTLLPPEEHHGPPRSPATETANAHAERSSLRHTLARRRPSAPTPLLLMRRDGAAANIRPTAWRCCPGADDLRLATPSSLLIPREEMCYDSVQPKLTQSMDSWP